MTRIWSASRIVDRPVRDHQRGPPGQRGAQRPLHRRLGLRVQVRGRLVHSLTSIAPATLKRSFIIEASVASSCIPSRVSRCSRRPTSRACNRNTGISDPADGAGSHLLRGDRRVVPEGAHHRHASVHGHEISLAGLGSGVAGITGDAGGTPS